MDKLKVINNALMKTGLPLAASLDDCDWNAQHVYESCVEQILRGYAWGFAQRFVTLGQSGQRPAHGYKYAYQLPEDCVRSLDVRCSDDSRAPKCRYVISGKNIYTNASPCNFRYVARVLDPEQWPSDFADAVSGSIAVEIASLSAEKMGMAPQLVQIFQLKLAEAQLADARENTERVPLNDSLYASRGGGQ